MSEGLAREIMQFFSYDHLPATLKDISEQCHSIAWCMAKRFPDNTEADEGLRKMLEAKDCFVRAQVLEANKVKNRLRHGAE